MSDTIDDLAGFYADAEMPEMPSLTSYVRRQAVVGFGEAHARRQEMEAQTMLACLACLTPMRRANAIRRARAWLKAESGSLDKAELGQRLRDDAVRPWMMTAERAEQVLAQAEAL